MKNKDEEIRKLVMEVTNNQINDNNPPVTRKTFERLKSEGFSEDEAKAMISEIVWAEVYVVVKEAKPFNLERFSAALESLPETPWDED